MTLTSIVNGLLFDPATSEVREESLHIEGDSIIDIGGSAVADARVIDARGALVSPGLIDAHFHANAAILDLLEVESSPASYVATHAARRLTRALRRGFTTVRDVAGGDLGLTRAIQEGLITGPRYLFTGRALSQTGGHGDPRPHGLDICCSGGHLSEIVDGVEDVRRAVRERFRTGAHAIKIFASGGVVSPNDPLHLSQYSSDEIRTACDEAARRHSYVAAHAYTPEAIEHAVTNGVRTVEHGNFLTAGVANTMRSRDVYLVPTLIAYDAMARRGAEHGLSAVGLAKNAQVLAAGIDSLNTARAADLEIGFGTDLMGELEDEQLHEFRLRIDSGDSVESVLASATATNSAIVGQPELATLGPGTAADIVVFDGNPIDCASILWSLPRAVLKAGELVS